MLTATRMRVSAVHARMSPPRRQHREKEGNFSEEDLHGECVCLGRFQRSARLACAQEMLYKHMKIHEMNTICIVTLNRYFES